MYMILFTDRSNLGAPMKALGMLTIGDAVRFVVSGGPRADAELIARLVRDAEQSIKQLKMYQEAFVTQKA